jgi:NADPH:quinone reductase-like Zn-dependent oxidoreductase
MKAVRFDEYGDESVLQVRNVPDPQLTLGRVLVRVKAAGINPGEASIRSGQLHQMFPATFPSGEGSDFAGEVVEIGEGVSNFEVGQAVLGYSHERSSHAELVAVPAEHLIFKPTNLSWEIAGSLYVAPVAAYASIQAVKPQPGETVIVSAAAGGVGSVAVQLARRTGATVIGLASQNNHEWLRQHGVIPVTYGEGQEERVREAAGGKADAMIDTFGGGYVELAVNLGIPPERINTVIDFGAAQKYGTQAQGNSNVKIADVLNELTALAASGELEILIALTYPLAEVQEAYRELARRHTHGKIVLIP